MLQPHREHFGSSEIAVKQSQPSSPLSLNVPFVINSHEPLFRLFRPTAVFIALRKFLAHRKEPMLKRTLTLLLALVAIPFANAQESQSSAQLSAARPSATTTPATKAEGDDAEGADPAAVGAGSPAPVYSGPDAGEQDPITPEQEVAIRAFIDAREAWSDTLVEMKSVSIRYSNEEDRSPAAKARYYEMRDLARKQMNETFDRAMDLFRVRQGDFESGSLLATMLEYRESTSNYENSLEAAEALLDVDLTYPFLYKIAARSAFLEGKFDRVMKHYEAFVHVNGPEKLAKVDNMVINLLDIYPNLWKRELEIRAAEAEADDLPRVLLETTRGPVTIELFENEAPNTVANFIHLVEDGYYDGSDFYQVIDDFLAMGGDPVGDGTSTSGKFIPDEHQHPNARQIFRGSLVMAKMPNPQDKKKYIPNSASSQFAIALMPLISVEPSQTIFGRVIDGMDVVSDFRRIDPSEKKEKSIQLPPDRIVTAKVIRKRPHDYKVNYAQ
jgi:cyclophilin family peptidyl-prolyl cis-trans isomerase